MNKLVFFFCLIPSGIFGQAANPLKGYPGIRDGVFVYFPPSRAMLLLGGGKSSPNSSESNVWKWKDSQWAMIPASGPGSRDFFPCAYHPGSGNIYCYGEQDSPGGVFWSFDGAQWKSTKITGLESRDHHQMVYADHLNAFIIYGGANERGILDTLTWLVRDGKATALNIPGPGIRYHSAMTYDKQRKKVVLYGGGKKPWEHWEFDGLRWVKINSRTSPGNKFYHFMAYDESSDKIILHGGWRNQDPFDPVNKQNPQTWAWDGQDWTNIAGESIFSIAFGYDAGRKQVVTYGRSGGPDNAPLALWILENGSWKKISDYGMPNTND
ncbi:MAG TPA: hypothetical protein PKM27_11560 [Saprospiraceae bacterium]|nr:hypothetical protein [Saprospiraceae bacterium]HNT22029.1 hypothetical protein [Saprospiraceae bacterium]